MSLASLFYQRRMNKDWLNKNTTAVISVVNASLQCPNLKYTREFTLERNHMDVISVDNISLKRPALKNTREFSQERNRMFVISVDNTSL